MSLWAKTQQLSDAAQQQVHAIYGDHFPVEVRHFLSSWLEEKMWNDSLEYDVLQRDAYVMELFNSFITEIEERANSMNSPDLTLAKMKLKSTAVAFQARYQINPHALFSIIRDCLSAELELLRQNEAGTVHYPQVLQALPDPVSELEKKLQQLRRHTDQITEDSRVLSLEQESYALQYHDATKVNAQLQHLATQNQNQQITEYREQLTRKKTSLDQSLQQKVMAIVQMRITLEGKLKDNVQTLTALQSQILDEELIKWKREQQLAGNGAQFVSNLDTIQEWCESLAEIIWMNRQLIKELEALKQSVRLDPQGGVVDLLTALNNHITQLLSSLVTSTFIIEKQPPQVMKTNTRFTSTVRLLVGGKLNVHMSPPQVEVSIISEAQANSLLQTDRTSRPNDSRAARNDVSGEILNSTGRMDYIQQTRQLTVQFRNMQLKKIKRAEKKGTESVMDEKFSLLFQTQFSVGGGELMFQVWTLSLPVVVIVHGNQEPHAWATVTWDNAFAEPGRTPFAVPDRVPWVKVAQALNYKFQSVTGRGLTEDNLRFLGEKAFRRNIISGDMDQMLLTWSLFCKEALPDRTFTFWEWFFAIMKLTREHLKGPWGDGSIIGFIKKQQAEEMLVRERCGTFLLRFSDSEPGGIVIAWLSDNSAVFMLTPFTSKDFGIRSMADRLYDLQNLVYLYPDTPKNNAFSKYYSPPEEPTANKNGYVPAKLVTQVPGHSHTYSTPATPQNMQQPLSPEGAHRALSGMDSLQMEMFPSLLEEMEALEEYDIKNF